MSEVKRYECDGCKKTIENPYAEKGWIHFSTFCDITVASGYYGTTAYDTIFTPTVSDFCSIECLSKEINRSPTEK